MPTAPDLSPWVNDVSRTWTSPGDTVTVAAFIPAVWKLEGCSRRLRVDNLVEGNLMGAKSFHR